MCLIVYSPDGQLMPREVYDYARHVNGDGIGIMSSMGVEKFLGPKAGKRAWRYLRTLAGTPHGVHFRWRTHGAITRALCHPFKADNSDAWVMHNGILQCTARDATDTASDTSLFVRRYMHGAPGPHDERYLDFYAVINRLLGWDNKLLVYHTESDRWTISHESEGLWLNGMWYSNDYSLPPSILWGAERPWDWAAPMGGGSGGEYNDRNVRDAIHDSASYYASLESGAGCHDWEAAAATERALAWAAWRDEEEIARGGMPLSY